MNEKEGELTPIEPEKIEPKKSKLKLWLKENQLIGYLVISAMFGAVTWYRQDVLEKRLNETDRNAVHRTETAFAVGITGLKTTAITLETSLIEQRTQNILLIEHCRKVNCPLPVELTTIKEMPKYTPISETYFGIQQIMIEKSKEGY